MVTVRVHLLYSGAHECGTRTRALFTVANGRGRGWTRRRRWIRCLPPAHPKLPARASALVGDWPDGKLVCPLIALASTPHPPGRHRHRSTRCSRGFRARFLWDRSRSTQTSRHLVFKFSFVSTCTSTVFFSLFQLLLSLHFLLLIWVWVHLCFLF